MRRILAWSLCLLLFTAAGIVAVAQDIGMMSLEEAAGYFQNDLISVEYSDAGQAMLESIIDTLRTALGVPDDLNEGNERAVGAFEVAVEDKNIVNMLSQAYYTLANVFLEEPEDEAIYLRGKNWGLKSLRMNPGFVELERSRFDTAVAAESDVAALYWTNSNWLRVAQKNVMQSVIAGVPSRVKAIMNRLTEIAPEYANGGPYRQTGAYFSGLPAGFGRDLDAALVNLCHVVDEPTFCSECEVSLSVEGANAYFENRTFFAEFYLMATDQWESAARILQSVLDEPIGELYPLMNAYSQENARELLDEVNEHL
ncbi:hypothetical protein JW848_06245 [Candidatus Bipolaricaulota bacterium]|nr:hypothetical protein [Candidatus Bipolaricaulota bacterium]